MKASIKAPNEVILHGLSWRDTTPLDLAILLLFRDAFEVSSVPLCALADAALPAQLLDAYPGLALLSDANDLSFDETAFPHCLTPCLENRLP